MKLQEKMSAFDALGVRVLALSYDEPDALKDFQDAYGIAYTLLSDPDSAVIRDYGILNTLIAEDDHPWFGIPFPGTYVADGQGRITHKFFENNLVLRVGPEELLRAVNGDALVEYVGVSSESATALSNELLQPKVFLEGQKLSVGVLQHLVCQFDVPDGRHLYADPAPEGMVPFSLTLDGQPKLVVRQLIRPESETHTMSGTAEVIQVHHGRVELRLPITANAATQSATLTLRGEVRWQTCDDSVCDVPQRMQFAIDVPVEGSVVSDIRAKPGAPRVRAMNGMEHLKKMTSRRQG